MPIMMFKWAADLLGLWLAIPIEARLAILFVLGCCAGAVINAGIYGLAWYAQPISPWLRPNPSTPPRRLWDRLPVIGWLGLRREAKLHGAGFWIRPMTLELLTGVMLALLYYWEVVGCGLVPQGILSPVGEISLEAVRHQQFLAHAVLLCFMLVAFWIDLDEMMIPDGVTIPGTLAGLFLVTLWPYALLPESPDNINFQFVAPMLTSVWLNSPDPVRPPPNPTPFLNPWEVPACMGWPALAGAIAIFCAWCLALAPGNWYTRHGYVRAVKVFTARMVRARMTYALLAMAMLGSLAIAWIWSMGGPHWGGLLTGLAGIAVGGGMIWLVRIFASPVLHTEAMGFGDVTLMAMIGAFFGWQATVVVFFLGPLFAIGFGVCRLLLRGENALPFGPFLCAAAVATVLGWPAVWGTQHAPLFFWNPVALLLGWQDFWELGRFFALHWYLIAILIGALVLMVVLLPPVHWIANWFRPK
jgi:leader peptidase (prepilin peptidase) / N-methyltransferase